MNRLLVVACLLALGCDTEQGIEERRAIHATDMSVVLGVVRQDLDRGRVGTRRAADRLAPGFVEEDAAVRERDLRFALRRIQQPPRAINELMVSPISFVAAVGTDGIVIARDTEPDPMRGFDLGAAVPVVQRALEGESGYALSAIPTLDENEAPSVTVVFAEPSRVDGEVVGVIASGLPLWRIGQQLTHQLQLENSDYRERGGLIWVFAYQREEEHNHAGFPPDLLALAPGHAARTEGLARSPGGYTGEAQQYGRWYGYGVLPLPTLGEDVGVVLFRSDPTR